MKVFISGGSGLVGRSLSDALYSSGHYRSDEIFTCSRRIPERSHHWISHDWESGVLDSKQNAKGVSNLDCWVQAAFAGPEYPERNTLISKNVLESILRVQPKRVILCSTGSVYGEGEEPFSEDTPVDSDRLSAYGKSSFEIEENFRSRLNGIPLLVARVFFPFGAYSHPQRLIRRLIHKIQKSEALTLKWIKPDTKESLGSIPRINPIYQTDLGKIFRFLVEMPTEKIPPFDCINIAGDQEYPLREIVEKISEILDKPLVLSPDPFDSKRVNCLGSIKKLRSLNLSLEFSSLDTSLTQTISNLRERGLL